jgi:hypothetical protein
MSFYFAYPANDDTEHTVSHYVRDMGLSLLKAKPSDINVLVVVASAQAGYASYIQNLPHFIRATSTEQPCWIGTGCAPFDLPDTVPLLPWTLPPLIYDYAQRITDRHVTILATHSEPVIEGRSRNQTFVMREPTTALIRTLVNMPTAPAKITRHVFGTVNLDAMVIVHTLISLTTALVRTHNYPSFRTNDDLNPDERAGTTESPMRKKRKVNDSYLVCATNIEQSTEELTAGDLTALATDPEAVPTIKLTKARPSDTSIQNWGPVGSIPNSSGMFVPYVKQLSISDTKTVVEFITHYLAKSLGTNLQQVVEQLQKLSTAWGIIRDTDFGHELSHLYKCLDIAIRGQAAVYPIFTNGVYEGAVIWGSGLMVGMNGRMYKPKIYAELQALVRDNTMHSKAIKEIKQLLGVMNETAIDACESVRGLSNIAHGAELSVENRQALIGHVHRLCYKNKYWSVSPRHILKALQLLATDDEIDEEVPMYPTMLFSIDRVELVLCAFGYQAPSLLIPNGQTIRLGSEDDYAPHNLHVRTVELTRAVSDMKHVMENSLITNNNQNLSSKHKDVSLNGKSKTDVWNALLEVIAGKKQAGKAVDDGQPVGDVGGGGAFDWKW